MSQTLVTEERYRALTGDLTTSQVDVLRNLDRAVRACCGKLNRPEGGMESAVRTETGYEYGHRLSPICTPVTDGPTVIPTPGQPNNDFDDAWIWAGFANPELHRRRKVTFTYTGGWTAYDGVTPLPADIEDAIVAAASYLSFPVARTPGLQLTGAKSAAVGDVSVSYGSPIAQPGQIPAGTFDCILSYRNRGLGAV